MSKLLSRLMGRTRLQRSVYLVGGVVATTIGVLGTNLVNEMDLAEYQRASPMRGNYHLHDQFYVPKSLLGGGLEYLGGWTVLCGVARRLRRRRTA